MLASIKPKLKNLDYSEGLRTLACMLPMVVGIIIGLGGPAISMGQAGFFYAAQPLSSKPFERFTNGLLFLVFGLGLYLIGGNVVFNYWVAVIFTFLVSLGLSYLNGWKLASYLAFSFFSVYSAGLNAGSPESVKNNFFAFALAILWCTLVSLPKWWKGRELSDVTFKDPLKQTETGLRMGIGTSISFAIAEAFNFSKLGWAPSATANVIRFDGDMSMKRANLRAIGTIVGAVAASFVFIFIPNPAYWAIIATAVAVSNGLFNKINKLGYLPFYTTTVLILYSLGNPSTSTSLSIERVAYNLVGVLVAVFFVKYPFPVLFKKIRNVQF